MKATNYQSIILHIPHSSSTFPAGSGYSLDDLSREERLLIDYHTDSLFLPDTPDERIDSIVFPYCRLYCDVERLPNDPLEKTGLGISYWKDLPDPSGTGVSRRSFGNTFDSLCMYIDYHSYSAKKILKMKDPTLLIDCHSFSSEPSLLNPRHSNIDICIGFNEDKTKPYNAVIDLILDHFRSSGYTVGINKPFSNSKTFPVPNKEYHSIMLEINKQLYMNEISDKKNQGFIKLHQEIQILFNELLHV